MNTLQPCAAATLQPPAAAESPGDRGRRRTSRAYPAHLVENLRLRDGSALTIRPIRAADRRLELDFLVGLSAQTRYQRLLSGRQLLPGELKRLTDIDYAHEMALVALATVDGRLRQIGVARYVRDAADDERSADFAIVVADDRQRRGLGELLLRSLLRAARADGVSVLGGITLSSNAAMLALAKKFGFTARREPGNASITELRLQIEAQRASSAFDQGRFTPDACRARVAALCGP
jgi:GNAT superfamily N-acetyltransferase